MHVLELVHSGRYLFPDEVEQEELQKQLAHATRQHRGEGSVSQEDRLLHDLFAQLRGADDPGGDSDGGDKESLYDDMNIVDYIRKDPRHMEGSLGLQYMKSSREAADHKRGRKQQQHRSAAKDELDLRRRYYNMMDKWFKGRWDSLASGLPAEVVVLGTMRMEMQRGSGDAHDDRLCRQALAKLARQWPIKTATQNTHAEVAVIAFGGDAMLRAVQHVADANDCAGLNLSAAAALNLPAHALSVALPPKYDAQKHVPGTQEELLVLSVTCQLYTVTEQVQRSRVQHITLLPAAAGGGGGGAAPDPCELAWLQVAHLFAVFPPATAPALAPGADAVCLYCQPTREAVQVALSTICHLRTCVRAQHDNSDLYAVPLPMYEQGASQLPHPKSVQGRGGGVHSASSSNSSTTCVSSGGAHSASSNSSTRSSSSSSSSSGQQQCLWGFQFTLTVTGGGGRCDLCWKVPKMSDDECEQLCELLVEEVEQRKHHKLAVRQLPPDILTAVYSDQHCLRRMDLDWEVYLAEKDVKLMNALKALLARAEALHIFD